MAPLRNISLKYQNVFGVFNVIRQLIPEFGTIISKRPIAVSDSGKFWLYKFEGVSYIIRNPIYREHTVEIRRI